MGRTVWEEGGVGFPIELDEEFGVGRGLDPVLDSRHDHRAVAGVDDFVALGLAFEIDVADAALLYDELRPHCCAVRFGERLGDGTEVEYGRAPCLYQSGG